MRGGVGAGAGAGAEGAYKTARKGVGDYTVRVEGVAAHAAWTSSAGTARFGSWRWQLEKVRGIHGAGRGLTVNAGVIRGGTRTNVSSGGGEAEIDVRIARGKDAARIDRKFRGLRVRDRGCVLEVTGGMNRPPMETEPRNGGACSAAPRHWLRRWGSHWRKPQQAAVPTVTLLRRWECPRSMEWAQSAKGLMHLMNRWC